MAWLHDEARPRRWMTESEKVRLASGWEEPYSPSRKGGVRLAKASVYRKMGEEGTGRGGRAARAGAAITGRPVARRSDSRHRCPGAEAGLVGAGPASGAAGPVQRLRGPRPPLRRPAAA